MAQRRHVFALAVALGAAGLGVTAAAFTTAIASVHRASAEPRQIVLAGLHFTYPSVNLAGALLLVLGMFGAVVIAGTLRSAWVRDPLRLACGRILSEALFFIPVLGTLCNLYADVAELSADRAAVRASAGSEAPLVSALLAFDESGPPGASGISPERVDSLLGKPPAWQMPARLLAGSLGLVSALSFLIWCFSGTAFADATFNLPILTSRPCVMIMIMLPLVGCVRMFARSARRGRRDAHHGRVRGVASRTMTRSSA